MNVMSEACVLPEIQLESPDMWRMGEDRSKSSVAEAGKLSVSTGKNRRSSSATLLSLSSLLDGRIPKSMGVATGIYLPQQMNGNVRQESKHISFNKQVII